MKHAGLVLAALLLTACGGDRAPAPLSPPPAKTAAVPPPLAEVTPSAVQPAASAPAPLAMAPKAAAPPPATPAPAPLDLTALLAGVPVAERIPVLTRAARSALADQRPTDAVLAANQATTEPGATAREQVLLARCLFEAGRQADAHRALQAAENGLDAVNDPTLFEDFLRLESQLLAAFGNVRELARGLEAQAARLTTNNRLTASAVRIRHGYRVRLVAPPATPVQLIALWSDREELAVVALPGAEKPLLGTGTADLLWDGEPPTGTLVVFAVDPAVSTAPSLARTLQTLPVDVASDEEARRPWRRFIAALRENPPAGAAVVLLPPTEP